MAGAPDYESLVPDQLTATESKISTAITNDNIDVESVQIGREQTEYQHPSSHVYNGPGRARKPDESGRTHQDVWLVPVTVIIDYRSPRSGADDEASKRAGQIADLVEGEGLGNAHKTLINEVGADASGEVDLSQYSTVAGVEIHYYVKMDTR